MTELNGINIKKINRLRLRNGGGKMNCPSCGELLKEGERRCYNCDYRLSALEWENKTKRIEGISCEEISALVQKGEAGYLERFEKLSRKRSTFNWASGVFKIHWMAGRKMKREWIIAFAALALGNLLLNNLLMGLSVVSGIWEILREGTIQAYLQFTQKLSWFTRWTYVANILLIFLFGFLGDRIYWKWVRGKVKEAGEQGETEEERKNYLERSGGFSIKLALLSSAVWFLYTIILNKGVGKLWYHIIMNRMF